MVSRVNAHRYGLALSLLAAACSGDDDGEPFRVRTGGMVPALVAYDAGDGWSPVTATERGLYMVPAAGPVTIMVACDDGGRAEVALQHLTPAAKRSLDLPCFPSADASVDASPVTLVPATAVAFAGQEGLPIGVPWPQEALYAAPGSHDIVASTDTRVLIRRAVWLPTAEPLVLDVDRDGSDLVPVLADLPAADPDESLSGSYSLMTAGGTRGRINRPFEQGLCRVPDHLVEVGDLHRTTVVATRDGGSRSVDTWSGNPDAVIGALPPRLDVVAASVEGDAVVVTWNVAPVGEHHVTLDGGSTRWSVVASEDWLAATGQSTAGRWATPSLDGLAGWNPAWISTEGTRWDFAVKTTDRFVATWTQRSGELPAAR
jgi:hypothetical protein